MYKFAYKLKITERVTAKCPRHSRYNPEKDGKAGIKGGCKGCYDLYDLHEARLHLDHAVKDLLRRTAPWTRVRERRTRQTAHEAEQEQRSEAQP